MHKFTGKILEVDLSSRTVNKKEVSKEWVQKYTGGIGFNARLLYDEIPPGADPLGPENRLVFSNGTLVGTPFPTASRTEASAKSPVTGLFGTSNSGAFFRNSA